MSTFIPPTPAATKSAEQHEEPSDQDSYNHLLFKVLRLTSEQVQDLNDWMKHRGIPNVHEIIVQNFRNPHELKDDLQFIRESKTFYIQANVMVSLSLMTTYIKHLRYLAKAKHFGPFYYIQIDPQDYDEWRISTPEEEIHFQTPSKFGSPVTPRSMATSEASESYITLTNFKKGIKRDASAYPIFKNERYYNTFIRHFKATAKAQGLSTLMDPNFTPGSDEYGQQLFQEQQDFLYSVLISSLKTDFREALVKDHEGDAQLILELLHEHHTGNSQYSRSEINRITKYLTSIKLDDTWRGTNESFLMHYNDQLRLLDSLVDSDEKLPDNTRVTFLESAVESVPDLRRVKITDSVLQAQLDSTRPISYRSYFDLLKDAAFHLDQATKRGNKIRRTNVHFSGPNDEDEHQNLSSDDPQVIQPEDVSSEPPEPLSYSVFQSHFQGSSTSNTQKIFLPKPIWEKTSVSCFTSHFMSLSTTGLILLSLTSTFLHHLMKRKVIGLALLTTKVTLSPGGSSLRILKRSSFVLVSEVPSELQQTSVLHHLQGRGPHFLFPFLILNNLQLLCHLTLLMHQPPILSNLSKVRLVKMKIIQSPWPTLTSPISLADPSFYHLRIMGSTTWPKSLTLMTMDKLLKTLNSS